MRRILAAISKPEHQKRIGEPGDAKPDAACVSRYLGLLRQREARDIDDIVEKSHGNAHGLCACLVIKARVWHEWIAHKAGEIDRAEIAGAIRRQGDLAAGIGRADSLAVPKIIQLIDAVDEQNARLGAIVGSRDNTLPKLAGRNGPHDPARHLGCHSGPFAQEIRTLPADGCCRKDKRPLFTAADCLHEIVGDKDGKIEPPQLARRPFGADELLDIGMIAPQGCHHCAAPRPGRENRRAHGIPNPHEGDGPEATVPAPCACVPLGRSVEKSQPMPPPCCMVTALSCRMRKMLPIESSIVPMTKQLKSVTLRPVPAPARMRPPGKNLKFSKMEKNRASQPSPSSGSAAASAWATLLQVAATDCSRPEGSGKRYLELQTCCEMAAAASCMGALRTAEIGEGAFQRASFLEMPQAQPGSGRMRCQAGARRGNPFSRSRLRKFPVCRSKSTRAFRFADAK